MAYFEVLWKGTVMAYFEVLWKATGMT